MKYVDSLGRKYGIYVASGQSTPPRTKKNDKTYLTLDTTKDALKNAPGFKYDRQTTTWVPDREKSSSR